jgi:putative hydrolase
MDDDRSSPFPGFGADDSGFGAFGPSGFDVGNLGAMLQQIGAMLQSDDTSTVPKDAVVRAIQERLGSTPESSRSDAQRFADAVLLADGWLDGATALPSGGALEVWTAREWINRTLDQWLEIVTPLAHRASSALSAPGDADASSVGLPPEVTAMLAGPMGAMVQRIGAVIFAGQVGQGLVELSASVVTTADLAVPLAPPGVSAVVAANVDELASGLGLPAADVDLYLVLRARAHQRLAAHAPWLLGRFTAAVDEYARGLRTEVGQIQQRLSELDLSNPETLSEAMASGVFAPAETPEQLAAQARVETLVALIDGWVDHVVTQAASAMPSEPALREALRRRRAVGGPAEQAFAALIGLELRPRRLREASQLWERLERERGMHGRDAIWDHPDLLPTSDDLDDPSAFLAGGGWDISEIDGLP